MSTMRQNGALGRSVVGLVFLFEVSLLLSACVVGRAHTSDSSLVQRFLQHEAQFNTLLTEVEADTKLESLQPGLLIYGGQRFNLKDRRFPEVEGLGLTKKRLDMYEK